jgi:beta-galactosidase
VQPHGTGLSYFGLVFDWYKALRSLGLSIDIVPASTRDFGGYKVIAAPGLMHMSDSLKAALTASEAQILLGPRNGARDDEMAIPNPLPPYIPGLGITVSYVESLRPDMPVALDGGGHLHHYCETLEGTADVIETTIDGAAVAVKNDNLTYIGAWLDQTALHRVISRACTAEGIDMLDLPDGLRIRDCGTERFWFNYNAHPVDIAGVRIAAADVLRQTIPDKNGPTDD